jgi:hypothetical protein
VCKSPSDLRVLSNTQFFGSKKTTSFSLILMALLILWCRGGWARATRDGEAERSRRERKEGSRSRSGPRARQGSAEPEQEEESR